MGIRRRRLGASIAVYGLLAFAVALLLAGGIAHLVGQVAFFGGLGLALLLCPPRWSPGHLFNGACVGLLAWTLIQLLPGTAPDAGWRDALHWAGLLERPSAAGIASWAQWVALVWLGAGLGWCFLAFEINGRLSRTQRRRALRAFAMGLAILGVVCFAMNLLGERYPLTPESHVFTYLPNRNHTGLLLALGGVVAFALAFERIARHRTEGVFLLLTTVGCFLGSLSTTSRAAAFLFLAGVGVWVLSSMRRQLLSERFKLIVPFGFLLLAVLFSLGQVTSLRLFAFFSLDAGGGGEGGVGRLAIYRDTLAMLQTTLPSGSGWGSFRTVFPYFRDESLNFMAIVHPESDWLWLLAESGLVGLVLVLGALAAWVRCALRGGGHFDRVRGIATLALVLALLHGLVDVPLHAAGVFVFLVWLAGLAVVAPENAQRVRALWLPASAWRGIGLLFVVVGAGWAYGGLTRQPWSGDAMRVTSLEMLRGGHSVPAARPSVEVWLDEAIAHYPFVWTLHTNQARAALRQGEVPAAAQAFRRARAAQVDQGVVTWTEGLLWSPRSSGRPLDAYRSTFLERDIFDRHAKFTGLLNRARQNPAVFEGLGRISRGDSGLRFLFLRRLGGDLARREVEWELAQHPRLLRYPEAERALLWFDLAAAVGWARIDRHFADTEGLAEGYPLIAALATAENEGWERSGARLLSLLPPPRFTAYAADLSPAQVEARYRLSSQDLAVALAFVRELAQAEDWPRLLEVTAHFRPASGISYPPSLHYWRARALTEMGRSEEASRWWQLYIRHFLQAAESRS